MSNDQVSNSNIGVRGLMSNVESKMPNAKQVRGRYYVIFGLLLISSLFLIDLFLYRSDMASINQRQFFGLLGNNISSIVFSFLALVVFCILTKKYINTVGFVLVISGAVTNIISRIFLGGVPDYFNLFSIPTFNLSDVCIVIGLVWLAVKVNRR